MRLARVFVSLPRIATTPAEAFVAEPRLALRLPVIAPSAVTMPVEAIDAAASELVSCPLFDTEPAEASVRDARELDAVAVTETVPEPELVAGARDTVEDAATATVLAEALVTGDSDADSVPVSIAIPVEVPVAADSVWVAWAILEADAVAVPDTAVRLLVDAALTWTVVADVPVRPAREPAAVPCIRSAAREEAVTRPRLWLRVPMSKTDPEEVPVSPRDWEV